MNRFDRPGQYDYSFDKYMPEFFMPNFQAWGQVIANEQQQDEATKQMMERFPAYIPSGKTTVIGDDGTPREIEFGDEASYKAFRQNLDNLQSAMTAAAQQGDMEKYREARKKAAREINRMWQPGGHAQQLQGRYESYVKGLEALKKQGNEDPAWAATNMPYAAASFYQTVGSHDPKSIAAQMVPDADVMPYLDIQEEAVKYAKQLGYDDATVEKRENGWVIKTRSKTMSDDHKRMLAEFVNSPKFGKQYQAERYLSIANMGPEQAQAMVLEEENNLAATKEAWTRAKELGAKPNKSQSEIKEMQELLQAIGLYNGKIDGLEGPETNGAIDRLNTDYGVVMSRTPKGLQEIVQKRLQDRYNYIASGVFDRVYERTMKADEWAMMRERHQQNKQLAEYEATLNRTEEDGILTDTGEVEVLGKDLQDRNRAAIDNLTVTSNNLDLVLGRAFANKYDKKNQSQFVALTKEAWEYSGADGQDFGKFAEYLQQKGYPVDQGDFGALWESLKAGTFQQTVDDHRAARNIYLNESASYGNQVYAFLAQNNKDIRVDGKSIPSLEVKRLLTTDESTLNASEKALKQKLIKQAEEQGMANQKAIVTTMPAFTPGKGTMGESFIERLNTTIASDKSRVNAYRSAQIAIPGLYSKQIVSAKVEGANYVLSTTGKLMVPVTIVYKEGEENVSKVVNIPLKEIGGSAESDAIDALNQDTFNEQGEPRSNASAQYFTGASNFARLSNTAMLMQQGALAIMTKKGMWYDLSPFSMREETPDGVVFRDYLIKGFIDDSGKTSFKLFNRTEDGQLIELKEFGNFQNIEDLQASLGLTYATKGDKRTFRAVEKPKTTYPVKQ